MAEPNLHEIDSAIYELEHTESSKSGYQLLASLYTVRDYMTAQQPKPPQRSRAVQPESYSGSDFLQAVSGKDVSSVYDVLDEHMEVMRVVNPRAYESVIRKLKKSKNCPLFIVNGGRLLLVRPASARSNG